MDIQNLKTNTIKGFKWFFYSFIWLFILMFAIDVISKQLIIANKEAIYNSVDHRIVLIPNFLAVSYVINHNVAFGIKIGNNEIATRAVYIVVALIASGAIVAYSILKRKTNGKYVKACLMLILAGALGNCVDRIFFTGEMLGVEGYSSSFSNGVVDWIDFFKIWKFNFNWADSCLVVGVIMLLVYLIVMEVLEYTRNKKKEPKVVTEKGVTQKVLSKEEQERLENDNKIKQENESKNIENGE